MADVLTDEIAAAVAALATALQTRGERLATAESCTGGMIAAACTALAGSSAWFECGVVTYSNAAKVQMVGVDAADLAAHGAVSAEVARAMADGVLARADATRSIAVTGIAGPGGATPGKPVGTVWVALGRRGRGARAERLQLDGDRDSIRSQTVRWALLALLDEIRDRP